MPQISISLARLIRYTYGGLLLFVTAAVVEPASVKPVVEALGPILAPLGATGMGIGIYVIHRYVLGELMLFPFVHWLHNRWDIRSGLTEGKSTSTIHYLISLGVKEPQARSAYTAWRAYQTDTDASVKEALHLQHSEIHVLYLTAEITLLGCIWSFFKRGDMTLAAIFLGVSFLSLASVIIADIRQHRLEAHLLKQGEESLKVFLQSSGHLALAAKGDETSASTQEPSAK